MMAVFGLTACDQIRIGNDRICTKPPALTAADAVGNSDPSDCVHRWAYRLAPGDEEVETVANAVIGGCRLPIINQALSAPGNFDQNLAAIRQRFREEALFLVVQARAGHCPIP